MSCLDLHALFAFFPAIFSTNSVWLISAFKTGSSLLFSLQWCTLLLGRAVLSETANITKLLLLSAFFCFSHFGNIHAQSTMFRHCFLMFSIVIGQRPDGSRVLLNRPHGTAQRVGSPLFRALFLSFGGSNRIRTVIYTFAEPVDWFQLRVSHSRIYLFFTYRPPTVVPSPRVAVVARPASPAVTDPDSSVASDV